MKKSLSLMILSSLLLIACTSKQHDDTENTKNQEEVIEVTDPETYKAQQEAAAEAYVEVESEAIAENDADLCNEIADENQMYSCRYQIIVNQAIKAKDPSVCDDIGHEGQAEMCKQNSYVAD